MVVRILKLLGLTLVVPTVGLVVGLLGGVAWLAALGVAGAVIPLVLVASQLWCAKAAGRDRAAMAHVFPTLTRATVAGLVVMVALQTLVALSSLWIGESLLIERVHIGLMITLGLGAVGAGWALVKAALASGQRPEVFAVGRPLTPADAPRLFAHVRALAARLGAQPPDHIVVGIDANFYVTSADVRILGRREPLQGETLYISSALARLFTQEELDAVVGHELGHFRGEDTAYSLRFAPVYTSLGHAVGGMVDGTGRVAWLALPAIQVLSLLYDLFAEAEAAVGRDRELEADRAGVEAAGSEAMASVLMKVSIHAEPLAAALDDPRSLDRDAAGGSLPLAFERRLTQAFDAAEWRQALEAGLGETVAHPIDTHPPVRVRLAAMGVDAAAANPSRLLPPSRESGADLIDGLAEIERALTQVYVEAAEPPFVAQSVLTRVADGAGEPAGP